MVFFAALSAGIVSTFLLNIPLSGSVGFTPLWSLGLTLAVMGLAVVLGAYIGFSRMPAALTLGISDEQLLVCLARSAPVLVPRSMVRLQRQTLYVPAPYLGPWTRQLHLTRIQAHRLLERSTG